MSILKNRVSKLESSICPDIEDIHVMRFIVDCGSIEPIGYRCGEVEIIRQPEESVEELKSRCDEVAVWPAGTSSHVFFPIYEQNQ
jgi:hypothetical protein